LIPYLPAATNDCGVVNYAIPSEQLENQFIGRVDSTINQKNSLYGRYFLDGYTSPAFFSPTNVLITTQPGNYERAQGLTIGETYVINDHTVNSFHATATRRRNNRGAAAEGIGPTTLGIDSYAPSTNFLELTVTNKWSTYCGTCAAAHFNVNTFSFADDVNMVLGKHQLAFGGEYVRSQLNINNLYESNGDFGITGVYKRLLLSAGLRWDPEYVPVDNFYRGSIFSMSSFLSNIHSTVFPNAPAGSFYHGDAGVPDAFTQNSPWQFSPRIGITFDPTGQGKTVFRAGSALVYDEPNFFTAQRVNQNPPFATAISNVPVGVPMSFSSPWSNGSTPSNPFPLPFEPPASTTFAHQAQFIVLPTHFHPPYTMQWTASVQQELSHGWQFQIDYIGAKTSFDGYGYPLNPAVYIPGTCGTTACSTTGNQTSRFYLTLENPGQGPGYAGGGGGSIRAISPEPRCRTQPTSKGINRTAGLISATFLTAPWWCRATSL
jgi:hypothetical protein